MTKELEEFSIPEWAVCPIVNADYSALEDEDIEKLDSFIENIVETFGNANLVPAPDDEYELGFCYRNDIDNLGSICYKFYLLP